MSNKTTSPSLEIASAQFQNDAKSHNVGAGLSQLNCTKCGTDQTTESEPERFDDLKTRVLAKRPYRCLECHHRFWVDHKTLEVSAKRRWTLAIVMLMFALLLLNVFGLLSPQDSNSRISVVVPEFSAPTAKEGETPSLASLINLPPVAGNREVQANAPRAYVASYQEQLTPQQRDKRLALAKQQAERAERASQARVEQLDRLLSPVGGELESLRRVEVGYVIERWREAWSNGDVDSYLLNYSPGFTPSNDLTLEAWKANRRYRVKPEKKISVELSNFDIAMIGELNTGVIEFNQRYKSGGYVENSRKRLNLVKEQGSWKITSEVEVN